MKAKKSLGQNFFINKNLGEYISKILSKIECDSVVEIGPGMGFFTDILVKNFENVTVVEKDDSLAQNILDTYQGVTVVNDDFLKLELASVANQDSCFFGSLPFNVSKPIIKKIIQSQYFVNESIFIIQKEVADKYIYKEPYSVLSLTTAIYANCKKILDISPESFKPKPKVVSSLISFTPNPQLFENRDHLEKLIFTSFKQPRKNLKNNLKGSPFSNISEEYLTKRAAQLSLDDYVAILKNSPIL